MVDIHNDIYIYTMIYIYIIIYIYNDKYIWIYTIIVDIIWMKHQKYTFDVHTFDGKCLWMSVDCPALGTAMHNFRGSSNREFESRIMPVSGYTQ